MNTPFPGATLYALQRQADDNPASLNEWERLLLEAGRKYLMVLLLQAEAKIARRKQEARA